MQGIWIKAIKQSVVEPNTAWNDIHIQHYEDIHNNQDNTGQINKI